MNKTKKTKNTTLEPLAQALLIRDADKPNCTPNPGNGNAKRDIVVPRTLG